MLKIEEDRAFLLSQRQKGRIGAMSSVDTVLSRKEKKRYEKSSKEQERRETAISKAESRDKEVVMLEDSSSTSDDDDESKDTGNTLKSSPVSPPVKRGRRTVITPELAAALDRHKVSSRSAVMVVGEAAKSLGQDVTPLTLNKSSIQRQRQQFRT